MRSLLALDLQAQLVFKFSIFLHICGARAYEIYSIHMLSLFSTFLQHFSVRTCTIVFLGRAFLFHKVVNLVYSEVQDRVMLTGRHMVRDVSCKNCATKLGWVYEFATEENQR